VEFGDDRLSYRELDERSNVVAGRLRGLGVGPEVLVGLCVEPGVEMACGLVGIVKAGGAYVPLDPSYPEDRLCFMLEDAGLEVLLTQEALLGRLPETVGSRRLERLALDTMVPEAGAASGPGGPGLASRVDAEDLAYVMYTSGSTGVPKGIGIPHRAVLRLVLGTDFAQLGPGDRVGQVSNISFDAATFEVWGSLLTGGTLVDVVMTPTALGWTLRDIYYVAGSAEEFQAWSGPWRSRVAEAQRFLAAASGDEEGAQRRPEELAPLVWFEDIDESQRLWGLNPTTYRIMQTLRMMPNLGGPMGGSGR